MHRGLGLVLCALFVVWFASGIVMLFARYPRISDATRLTETAPLAATEVRVAPASLPTGARRVVLTSVETRPAYRVYTSAGVDVVFADDGQPLEPLSVARAAAQVRRHILPGSRIAFDTRLTRADQWTLNGYDGLFPLLRFTAEDGRGIQIYVSERTGAVVQRTTRRERVLAWMGAIPHWIYPAALRRHRGPWRLLVIALSLVGAAMCAAGLAGGVMLRRRGSPYRKRWLRLHHYAGLAFGALAFTWVLSGALSLNPLRWSPGSSPPAALRDRAAGGSLSLAEFTLPPQRAIVACSRFITVRELEFVQVLGRPYYRCVDGPLRTRLIAADDDAPHMREFLSEPELVAVAGAAQPGARLHRAGLRGADAYYYQKHLAPARRFPVFRADFDDDASTSLYIDPSSGALLARHTRRTRIERWLYNGLHSLDLPGLYRRHWLWLAVALALLGGGLVLSSTGLVLAARRARFAWRRRSRSRNRTEPKGNELS